LRRAIIGLFAASGASGLILEIVWSRMLGWLFGATTWSVMVVLVSFMGGLGLGSILWGRLVGRAAHPLRLFGLMEIAIGLYTLAVPFLFDWLGRFFAVATRALGDSPAPSVGLRVSCAVLALAPPTLLLGGTLPVLTRFTAAGWGQPGRTAGLLYAANTAGAVAGCFLTGCLLISWLGVIETNLLAASIDVCVGSLALLFGSQPAPSLPTISSRGETRAGAAAAGTGMLLVTTVSGFCGLAYELLWTRSLLAAITDDTTYAFTLMLTAYLAGHALGAALAGRAGADSRADPTWQRLGTAQVLASATALCSVPFLVVAHLPINSVSFAEGMTFWGGRIPLHLAVSLVVFAPSAAFLGASFSLAARLYVGTGQPVGESTGRLYGLNTAGAVLGAIAATAWLIPQLGTQQAIVALALFQAALGAAVMLWPRGRAKAWRGRAYTVVAWSLVIACACAVNFFFRLADIYARQEPGRLLALVEGASATVTVHQRNPTDRVISINGVNVAGTNLILRTTQKLQAHLPVCLQHRPRSVLQIGFGSGGTCYSLSLHPEVESIEVVELNPDVLKVAATWFKEINHGVLDDPRVRVRIADARSHVAVTDATYDVILSDSTHPRFRGNAALYSRDYFADCARRLRPGGLMSTWLPLYGLSVDDMQGILKSLHAVFPHVQVWYPNSEPHENTILIASMQAVALDPELLTRRLAESAVAADLGEVGIVSTLQFLDFFMLGDGAVAHLSETGRLNTDNHPRLEFLAPHTLRRRQSWVENLAALLLAREPVNRYLTGADAATREKLNRWFEGTTWKLTGQLLELEGRFPDALSAYSEGVRLNPDDAIARNRLARLGQAIVPGVAPRPTYP
jgi:spermidine synthase